MDDNGCVVVVDLLGPRLVQSTTCMEQNKKKHKKQQKRGSTIRRRVVRKERAPKSRDRITIITFDIIIWPVG